jgi:peroxiredoxin
MHITRIPGIFFTLLVLYSPVALSNQTLTELPDRPVAANFMLPDMDGKIRQLTDYRGRTVIINFWATWCPPCREELPSMNRAWQKVRGEGIDMIAINVGEDEDTIFTFTGDYPIDFTVLLDLSGNIINEWPVRGLPTTFVVDPDGRIIYRAVGGREWDDDKLLDMIRGQD